MPMGVLAFHREKCVYANEAARQLFGRAGEEFHGLSHAELSTLLPGLRDFEHGAVEGPTSRWVQLVPPGRAPVTVHVSRIPTARPHESLLVVNPTVDAQDHRLTEAMVLAAR